MASSVPIFIITNKFGKKCNIDKFNLPTIIKGIPLFFGIINAIFLPIFRKLNITNLFIIGALLSFIYSSTGRYIGIPQKILEVDPNKFQISAIFIWAIFYGIVGNIYYK